MLLNRRREHYNRVIRATGKALELEAPFIPSYTYRPLSALSKPPYFLAFWLYLRTRFAKDIACCGAYVVTRSCGGSMGPDILGMNLARRFLLPSLPPRFPLF